MVDEYMIKHVSKIIKENAKGREVVFWGKQDAICEALLKEGIYVQKVFSGNKKPLEDKNLEVYSPEKLKDNNNVYYVVIAVPFDKTFQKDKLTKWGYSANKDYCWCGSDGITIKELAKKTNNATGNLVKGKAGNVSGTVDGFENHIEVGECKNLKIVIKGSGNTIKIGNVDFEKAEKETLIHCMGNNGNIVIEDGCRIKSAQILIGSEGELRIGMNSTFAEGLQIRDNKCSKILIGNDCMFSFDVIMQGFDGHTIFDVKTQENINCTIKTESCMEKIVIGDHVWVGRNAMILGGEVGLKLVKEV